MDSLAIFILGFALAYCVISWLVPRLLGWLIKRRFHIDAQIGRIQIPYLSLEDVHITKNGWTIHIDRIGFRSSFLSSEVTKLVSVVMNEVRINKDVGSGGGEGVASNAEWSPPLSFHDYKIPPIVITFAQFMAVRISSVAGMLLRPEAPEWLLHTTIADVVMDGSVVHSTRSLLVHITVGAATAKLLRHAHACLAEISVAMSVEATVSAQGPLSVEKVSIGLEHTKAVINERFYSFAARERHKPAAPVQTSKTCVAGTADIIHRLTPIIPKALTLKLADAILTGARDVATLQCIVLSTTFSPAIASTTGIDTCGGMPQVSVGVKLNGLDVRGEKETILSLQKLSFDIQLLSRLLNVHLSLTQLSLSYNHLEIYTWVAQNFLQSTTSKLQEGGSGPWWQQLEVQGVLEMWNVSAMLRLCNGNTEPFTRAGANHFKFVFASENSGESGVSTSETVMENVWLRLAPSPSMASSLHKHHSWGTPLFMAMALVTTRGSKLEAMVHTLRAEWSPPLATLLTNAKRCVEDYQPLFCRPVAIVGKKKEVVDRQININIQQINAFFIAGNKVCLMTRIDTANIDSFSSLTGIHVEGAIVASIAPNKPYYVCQRSEEVKGGCVTVNVSHVEWRSDTRCVSVKLCNETSMTWSANLHLKLLTLLEEVNIFRAAVHRPSEKDVCGDGSVRGISFKLRTKARITCGLILSKLHQLHFTAEDLVYAQNGRNIAVESSLVEVMVDEANIVTMEGVEVRNCDHSEAVRLERTNTEGLELAVNRVWSVRLRSLKMVFPYEHQFAEAVQNELLSVVKWLKLVHKKQTPQHQSAPILPADLIIKVSEFLFEMSDDPFEVRLRDNYELLEDEFKESLKRHKMLDTKVADLCKAHLLLPAGKVEELYASLCRMNAGIYVQRSRQMRRAGTRSRLFAWIMADVRIIALADPTLHGPDNVVRTMTHIDPDSPWPEEGLEFSTLWCRCVAASCREWKFQLRDFPQPWVHIGQLHLWGRLVGAEQVPTRRAKRGVVLELGEPWGEVAVERSMTSLKLYHDLNCDIEHFSYAFGPCWEPVIAQCILSFEKISRPSRDPSPPLPFWDRMRLLTHGRITLVTKQLTLLLHASLDPYNTTEEMELTWTQVAIDWTNAKLVFNGDLDVYVRTASKYDDCRLLHLPNLKLTIKLSWLCLGDTNDHHSVMPCAPDKLPEYSSNQVHDSYRAFRSQNLNISVALETKPVFSADPTEYDCPVALLYGSTLRWFENLKLILSGVTRPTRKGTAFGDARPRKCPLSRHYRKCRLLLCLHSFQVHYWMSFAMQRGLQLISQRISSSSEHTLTLVPVDDGLKHRPRPAWAVMYMNCVLNDAEIWLKTALQLDDGKEQVVSLRQPVEKCYCLSVGQVSYGREASDLAKGRTDTPTHRLVVHHLKGAWTMSNRDVAFALFDTFMKTKQLKKNLSTEALKGFRGDTSSTPLKPRNRSEGQVTPPPAVPTPAAIQATPSPMTKLQSGHAATMLQQLIAEAENKAVVFSDDLSTPATREQHLQGLVASHQDDVVHKNWLIALVNSQVLLKGIETKGYVILSAAKAEILQRAHRPVWKQRTLVSKTSWVGTLECMQYYATVSQSDSLDENIMWLDVENIQEKDGIVSELADLVGSGQSVGGVVSQTVGATSHLHQPLQLQRIVSRCKCEFFYAGYGESSIDPSTLDEVPAPPVEEGCSPWEQRLEAVDAFTLMHHDLDVCTNSLQYAMILDIVNNLLLYVEPRRKEAYERLQRMRFQLQLHSVEDQRRPIQQLQNHVRSLVSKLRRLEKETYLVQRALAEEPGSQHLLNEMEALEAQVYDCKELVVVRSDELDMMLSCYKETQLMANQKLATLRGDKPVTTERANEICFKHAQWRLTEADGQLGIADLVLTNFLYTKNSKSDDSVEHLLELGYVRMTNLLPNQIYKEVLVPTEIQSNMPVDRKRAVRVFCREKAPVGGISVKEHFEINVVPLTIGLTKKFYNTMLKFCFPERDPDAMEGEVLEDGAEGFNKRGRTNAGTKKGKDSNFYVRIDQKDDVEKMKERAEKNKLFIYIKIPEVPVRVSYKGNKEKNLKDIRDFSLVIPTLEYHNVTWTWLDLLLAMKTDSRRVILSQAIKQKLNIKMNRGASEEGASPQEEDKARMLFGARLMPGDSRSLKKGVFKFPK